jgi:hypothetical protein
MYNNLTRNLNGSYTFIKDGLPYNCPNFGEWEEEFAEVDAYAKEHPEEVTVQQPVVETLEEKRQDKFAEIDHSFNERVKGYMTTTQGYMMQFQPEDSLKMQGSIMVLESMNIPTGYLTQYNDETIRDVPLETMKDVMMQMMRAYAVCHEYKQNIRALINSAGSKEDLDAVTIEWPI